MPIFQPLLSIVLEKCGFKKEYIGLIDTPVGVEKIWQRGEIKYKPFAKFIFKYWGKLTGKTYGRTFCPMDLVYILPNPHIQWLIKICQAQKPRTSIWKSCWINPMWIPNIEIFLSVTMCPLCANCSTWPLHQICDYTRIACTFLSSQLFVLTLFSEKVWISQIVSFLLTFHL